MYVVDAHCHLPEGFTAKDLEFAFSLGFMDQTWALSAPLTHWTGTRDNDETLLELARDFPGKLIPFGYLNLAKGPDWVDRQKERGFAGLKAHTPPRPWDDDSFFPVYERAQALGMPVVFHTGQAWTDTLDHYPYADSQRSRSTDWMHVERLDVVIKTFQSLTVIAAHFGWPHCEAAIGMAMTHPNFYLDTSGYVSAIFGHIGRAVTGYGIAHKILMGTDVNLMAPTQESRRAQIQAWQERVIFWKQCFLNFFPQPAVAPDQSVASVVDLTCNGNARRLLGAGA